MAKEKIKSKPVRMRMDDYKEWEDLSVKANCPLTDLISRFTPIIKQIINMAGSEGEFTVKTNDKQKDITLPFNASVIKRMKDNNNNN